MGMVRGYVYLKVFGGRLIFRCLAVADLFGALIGALVHVVRLFRFVFTCS